MVCVRELFEGHDHAPEARYLNAALINCIGGFRQRWQRFTQWSNQFFRHFAVDIVFVHGPCMYCLYVQYYL